MIQGLSHMRFVVADLDRMETMLVRVLGARRAYDSGEKTYSLSKERFFLAGAEPGDRDAPAPLWIAIMEGESAPSRSYNRVAFKIDDADYERALAAISDLGLDVREGRARVDGEGRSIYFHDWDNHLFELHTGTLDERLRRYRELQASAAGIVGATGGRPSSSGIDGLCGDQVRRPPVAPTAEGPCQENVRGAECRLWRGDRRSPGDTARTLRLSPSRSSARTGRGEGEGQRQRESLPQRI